MDIFIQISTTFCAELFPTSIRSAGVSLMFFTMYASYAFEPLLDLFFVSQSTAKHNSVSNFHTVIQY